MDYKKTGLWKLTLGLQDENYSDSIAYLRDSFESVRKKGEYILKNIRIDFPSLTIHDITHVDSLWQVASIIIGEDYPISPLEGFVLGCAFVMHDAVLSYEAAGGKEALRNTDTWKDYYTDFDKLTDLTDEQKCYETDFKSIRLLHALYAKDLFKSLFHRKDGSSFYIIENESIRNHLGELICKIASSHHWDFELLETLEVQFPAPSEFPVEWRINPIKLACILRCADAGHIDSGRAPDYLLRLLDIRGVSRDHWISQNRLSQIDINVNDPSQAIIKSNINFKEEDFSAWNVAYDAICVLSNEIKNSNLLLKKHGVKEFKVKSICGSTSQEELAKYIKTDGWKPCDASIHISNVEDLIRNLGGEKLYGSEHKLEIVLRELIQNARDAIKARENREPGIEGKITVSIKKKDDKVWFSVSDNGVGMSLRTIKDYFLNFGSSFWASDLCKQEYPGLSSSGYESVGKFGIGFYSIFMVSSEVLVETRKFDKGLDEALIVKFPRGLTLRPLICSCNSLRTSISTVVSFSLDRSKCMWKNNFTIIPSTLGESSFDVPYSAVIANLTAGLDVDVYYSENEEDSICVHHNVEKMKLKTPDVAKWLKDITYSDYYPNRKISDYIDNNYMRVQKIEYNGKFYGYAALNTCWDGRNFTLGITTVGGLNNYNHASKGENFLGFVLAKPATAKRDGNIDELFKTDWARQQYAELCVSGLSDVDKLFLPYYLGIYGIDMTEDLLVHTISNDGLFSTIPLKNLLFSVYNDGRVFIIPKASWADNYVEVHLDVERSYKRLSKNEVLFYPSMNSEFLSLNNTDASQYTLIRCIQVLQERYSLPLSFEECDNKFVSKFFGECKGLVIRRQNNKE